ncbi:MAG: VCBS repeat-containing protein [Planctomycetes bacterium]|nr:VCBS repeat-containing protein [Planctomycetota bacterium]
MRRRVGILSSLRSCGFALSASFLVPATVSAAACQPGFEGGDVFSVGSNVGMCALVDLDGDGHLDLTTGKSIFLGDGRGGVSQKAIALSASLPWDLGASDFDGDGRLDVVLLGERFIQDGAAQFLFGQPESQPGDPRFGDEVTMPTVDGAWHLGLGDFLEDGRMDVAAVGRGQTSVAVLINQGDRTFVRRLCSGLKSGGHSMAIGDYDGDGHTDIAAGEGSDATVFFGEGDGTFPTSIAGTLYVPPGRLSAHRFRAGDLDGDGRAELLAIGEDSIAIYPGSSLSPKGKFPTAPDLVLSIQGAGRFMEIVDANGDGLLDVVAQTNGGTTAVVQLFAQAPDTDGTLSFEAGPAIKTKLSGRGAVLAVGDLDEDGAPDLALTTEDTRDGQLFLNDGTCIPVLPKKKRGDANADDQLDLADPVGILSHLFAAQPLACPEAAEVNGDAQLDLGDAVYLLSHLFASGPAPAGSAEVYCGGGG